MKPHEEFVEYNYHLLRNALERFSKNVQQLSSEEYQQVAQQARKSYELESLVLGAEEAKTIVVPSVQIDQAMTEIRARYASDEEFDEDLNSNGLDREAMRAALYRELLFDGVMQLIGSQAEEVSDLDIQLFYEMHHDRFEHPEKRQARHILVTVNPEYAENTEQAARARIDEILQKLNGRSNRFDKFAKRYSECPTAMEGGKLGEMQRGQLFPELDSLLFAMAEDEISEVVESEMGFHILWCEKIKPAKRVPLNLAAERIHEILDQRRRKACQKSWLDELRKAND